MGVGVVTMITMAPAFTGTISVAIFSGSISITILGKEMMIVAVDENVVVVLRERLQTNASPRAR